MTRLVLVLVAAVLGTGCIFVDDDDCPRSTFTVQWDFQGHDGAFLTGCADVEWVDIYMNGQLVGDSFPCTGQRAVITAVRAGSYDMTVEGIDTEGRIAYRDQFTAESSGCGDRLIAAQPAEGIVNLDYAATCTSSPCFLWFAVHDDIANTVAAAISATSPAHLKDDYPYPDDVIFRLAAGSYTLDWMQLVSASYTGQALSCAPIPFEIAAASQTDVPVTLDAACQL